MNIIKLNGIVILSLSMTLSYGAKVTQVNRYATIENKPLLEQVAPLLAIQQIHFPQEINTVGEAVRWWLRYSGFTLVSPDKQSESLKSVLKQPLPLIHRNLGPLTIKDGLVVLVGQKVFVLTENPLLREVNFKLKANIKPISPIVQRRNR